MGFKTKMYLVFSRKKSIFAKVFRWITIQLTVLKCIKIWSFLTFENNVIEIEFYLGKYSIFTLEAVPFEYNPWKFYCYSLSVNLSKLLQISTVWLWFLIKVQLYSMNDWMIDFVLLIYQMLNNSRPVSCLAQRRPPHETRTQQVPMLFFLFIRQLEYLSLLGTHKVFIVL